MQCENCGRPLRPEETLCPNCGEPIWPDASGQPTVDARQAVRRGALQVGPPVDPFAPTVYGPHAPPRTYTPPAIGTPTLSPRSLRRPIWPAPVAPPRYRWGTGCLPLVGALAALAVVALLMVGALAASGQLPGLLGNDTGQQPRTGAATHAPTSPPSATQLPACPLGPVDATAAMMLKNVQLTSGLTNVQKQDYRPIDDRETFHPGQTLYVTYQIATNASGTVAANLCTVGSRYNGSTSVPRGYLDARGYFSTTNPLATPQDIGPGAVILTWNGAVAAALPFQVTNS